MATSLAGADTAESLRRAVMWLELTEGVMRQALAERLAQAHMSDVADPIETPHERVREA